jgi:hypothetical protein
VGKSSCTTTELQRTAREMPRTKPRELQPKRYRIAALDTRGNEIGRQEHVPALKPQPTSGSNRNNWLDNLCGESTIGASKDFQAKLIRPHTSATNCTFPVDPRNGSPSSFVLQIVNTTIRRGSLKGETDHNHSVNFVEGTETSLFHFSVASAGHVLQIGSTKTCQKPGKMASGRTGNWAQWAELLYLC